MCAINVVGQQLLESRSVHCLFHIFNNLNLPHFKRKKKGRLRNTALAGTKSPLIANLRFYELNLLLGDFGRLLLDVHAVEVVHDDVLDDCVVLRPVGLRGSEAGEAAPAVAVAAATAGNT